MILYIIACNRERNGRFLFYADTENYQNIVFYFVINFVIAIYLSIIIFRKCKFRHLSYKFFSHYLRKYVEILKKKTFYQIIGHNPLNWHHGSFRGVDPVWIPSCRRVQSRKKNEKGEKRDEGKDGRKERDGESCFTWWTWPRLPDHAVKPI